MLRKLEKKDAPFMLEWLKDKEIMKYYAMDESFATIEKANAFIQSAQNIDENMHLAFEKNGEYMGTVSLKHISKEKAEFAIASRRCAQGTGDTFAAAQEILLKAFDELLLKEVWLSVYSDNERAKAFYKRLGFVKCKNTYEEENDKKEYFCLASERYASIRKAPKAEELEFRINGDERGKLVAIEGIKDIPFEIKRIFYCYDVPKGEKRGCHANRESEFVMAAVSGSVNIKVDNGFLKQEFKLEKGGKALYLPKMTYKVMEDFSQDAVLLVISSKEYTKAEYISDRDEFLNEARREI